MHKTTITSKGQVTVPSELREAMKLRAGDQLEFLRVGDELRVRVLKRHRASELRGILRSDVPYPGKDEERRIAADSLGDAYR